MTITRRISFSRRSDRTKAIRLISTEAPAPPAPPVGRVPRVARLMALAIHFDRIIRQGHVRDLSELARLTHVTQPRATQILNLNHLAPDLQEMVLHLPRTERGRDPLTERDLRPIAAIPNWIAQRKLWRALRRST